MPLARGAGLVTPLQLSGAYSVFANDAYRINPYLIAEVDDARGAVISRADPLTAAKNVPQTLESRNAYIINSLLHTVATQGTGSGTNALKRNDLQGKTGMTNDVKASWFAGYQKQLVAVAWMGYDQPKTLGSREFDAQLALPIWVQYMTQALRGIPQQDAAGDGQARRHNDRRREMFYADRTPGTGFVASIGLDNKNPMAGDATMMGGGEHGGVCAAATSHHDERRQAGRS